MYQHSIYTWMVGVYHAFSTAFSRVWERHSVFTRLGTAQRFHAFGNGQQCEDLKHVDKSLAWIQIFFVCMTACVCFYARVYICMSIYMHAHRHTHTHIQVPTCGCMYIWQACTSRHTNIHVQNVYTHTHINFPSQHIS